MSIIWQLFTVFLRIGAFSIGGGYAIIPLIQEQVVERYGWISEKMFTDIITISQMTPGPLAVNTSTFVGLQIGGTAGALAATLGCILVGVIISLSLYAFFQKHQGSTYVLEVLNGLRSASTGLMLSAALTIILLALTGSKGSGLDLPALFLFLVTLAILRKWKPSPIVAMLLCGIAGAMLY